MRLHMRLGIYLGNLDRFWDMLGVSIRYAEVISKDNWKNLGVSIKIWYFLGDIGLPLEIGHDSGRYFCNMLEDVGRFWKGLRYIS